MSIKYSPAFVMHRNILSIDDKQVLHSTSDLLPLSKFKTDVRNYEEMAVDFIYTSAKIEGNTYDRIDTDNLLRLGVTAGGKRYSDAVMLVNLRDGFSMAMAAEKDEQIDLDYLGRLHKVLMKDLLPVHEQGIGRTSPVIIGASSYKPLNDPQHLRTEVKFIFAEADKYDDPFERSIYLHCNLAYLQFFRDGNKRSARLIQTATLVSGDKLPLFFNDSLIDKYQRATVGYYETGDYAPYVAFFKENYNLAVGNLIGVDPAVVLKSKIELMPAQLPSGLTCMAAPFSVVNDGVEVVMEGAFTGTVKEVSAQFVVQDVGRGRLVAHEVSRFASLPLAGENIALKYKHDKVAFEVVPVKAKGVGR